MHPHPQHRLGPPNDSPPRSPPQPGPLGTEVALSTTHISGVPPPNPPQRRTAPTPSQPLGSTAGTSPAAALPSPPLPHENAPPPPSPLHAPPSPTRSDRSINSNKRPRSELHDTPDSRAAEAIAEEVAASSNTPIHHPEAQDDLDVNAMEEEEL